MHTIAKVNSQLAIFVSITSTRFNFLFRRQHGQVVTNATSDVMRCCCRYHGFEVLLEAIGVEVPYGEQYFRQQIRV